MKTLFSILVRMVVYWPLLLIMDRLCPTTTNPQEIGHLALFVFWAYVTEAAIIATVKD